MIKHWPILNLRTFLFFYHSSVTIIISFLPVYFQSEGLSETEIGWLMAIGPCAALFSQPFWGIMSDKYKTIKRMILICLFGVLFSSTILFQMSTFLGLLAACALMFFFNAPTGALADSLTQRTSERYKISFGSIRTFGSLGFAFTALISGQILSQIGIRNMYYPYLFYIIIAFLVSWRIFDVPSSNTPVRVTDAVKLASSPRFFMFLLISMFFSIGHRTNDSFLGLYISKLGGGESLIGLAWFVAVLSEALAFATSRFWFRRYSELTFIIIAGVIYTIRWLLSSIADNSELIILLQVFHGLSFGIFYTASFKFISKLAPKELQATGHLLFISVFFGLSGIIGSAVGGAVLERLGGSALYKDLAFFSMAGILGVLVYQFVDRKNSVMVQKGTIGFSGKSIGLERE
ncbi:MFS transporter [Effusibacillus consociatus]|uniref:MFS transporter n=1 Tax=Effusibacillus consociatus TaxID=1117041 RepID=A0ABV9PVQ6_9BACL